ncbi:hypothetical protein ANN_21295 [Periplaneta americana]|uniref:RNase H type-1 domain-containing protein n=1 Tax=Periplaneta americana TaxID=6978 RepID=A0ABQ8SEX8_PERAM|nr:hypothetical protein ANN_21295 [Periplaneta americana]
MGYHNWVVIASSDCVFCIEIQKLATAYESTRRIQEGIKIDTVEHYTTWPHPEDKILIKEKSSHESYKVDIYTDGSKGDLGVGSGVAIFIDQELVHELQYKLHRRCSNNQAEQYPILKALEQLENKLENRRKLETLNWTIHFAWVKAHVGLAGNELADHLAKQAASNELPVSFDRIPVSDIMRELQEESVVKWESEWQNTINGAVTKSFFPSVKERLRVNIPLNGEVTTFLTGHGKTDAYLYRFKLRDNPSCACGAEEQTVDHHLFECPKLDKERLAFQREMLRKTGKWTFTKLKIMQEHAHTFTNYVNAINLDE